jgi:hypothetical protein
VHAALKIEAVLERDPPDRGVVERPVGAAVAHLDVARENSPDRRQHEGGDEDEAVLQVGHDAATEGWDRPWNP